RRSRTLLYVSCGLLLHGIAYVTSDPVPDPGDSYLFLLQKVRQISCRETQADITLIVRAGIDCDGEVPSERRTLENPYLQESGKMVALVLVSAEGITEFRPKCAWITAGGCILHGVSGQMRPHTKHRRSVVGVSEGSHSPVSKRPRRPTDASDGVPERPRELRRGGA